ncbi:baseplate J/gp47 family protein [Silvimonas sp.]|uniref:baseplate J/gp47 family protein n=1 Tax=Silvimonas sp. TaxID=2650811 RepID=UPI002840C54E|nr:baseplate J/gp47 family protein [Silvimonas sp.]MDR3429018.1 baseplate J/gp47 family protein [Silvimonas sp.]
MSGPIDLSQLPVPVIIESLDFETIFAERKIGLIALVAPERREEVRQTLLLESEPLTLLLQESAYRELVLRQRINEACLAVMVPYAEGPDLDNLAAGFNVSRLLVSPADNTVVPPITAIYEPDDELRPRIPDSFEGMSVAGPSGAYLVHARAADGRIADVSVESPEPCDIVVAVLSREGDGTASQDILANVMAALSDEDVRPLGDRLTVQSAEIVPYGIEVVLYLYRGPEAELVLAAANARIDKYRNVQRKLGRSIRHSALDAASHVEGVEHVGIVSPPEDIVLTKLQAGFCTGITIRTVVLDD